MATQYTANLEVFSLLANDLVEVTVRFSNDEECGIEDIEFIGANQMPEITDIDAVMEPIISANTQEWIAE